MLQVTSDALLAGGAAITGVTAAQGSATAAAMPVVSALVPSGVDTVSALASTAFSAQGIDFSAMSALGTALLGMAAEGMMSVGAAYQAVDAAGAARVI
jgi:hypothetical protein